MEEHEPSFATAEETIEYYKNLAVEYKKKFTETQQELEEYQEGSRDLETELEIQLEQAETRNKELLSSNQQLKLECERLQAKLNSCQNESSATISRLQEEVQKLQIVRDDLQQYVRKLEQKNDDFERATRASLMSLEDFETRLNQAIERNAFLENELDEKENMAVLIQRLKDEARDLKQELLVHDAPKNGDIPQSPSKHFDNIMDSNKLITEAETANRVRVRRSNTRSNFLSNAASNVPHSALNIVGDLLKKVGVLESKLQSCRDCIKDNSDHIGDQHKANSLTSTSRVRHLNGTSLSNPKDFIPLTA
ncbi:nuclear distribution protein nudE homolog 1-like isoform X2 [Stegodyphus dumicola]|uniref:nuclear distribution protein nudE homolog 1-like isoform X2 n=1 Tax=Stegodyphus dumicola TaxID=202533 RepID=UPI0015ADA021|nr:nuclear distribution protein nudE homolog 1-like isoform X2 [Stegodyphus dumicola]